MSFNDFVHVSLRKLVGDCHCYVRYDFTAVVAWMAERVDRIILLFDAHKLDISDEFRRAIHAMRGYDEKIRIVLNKADMVDHQHLMRVYGALMWSLGKVFNTPEVCTSSSNGNVLVCQMLFILTVSLTVAWQESWR